MSCNCEGKNYNISFGCCEPVLGPIENYYTKYQIDKMIASAVTSGCCITPEEVDEKIEEAISGITVSGVTEEELNNAIASAKTEIEAEIPTVPTSNTAFTNDAGYLTEHQSLTAYSTTNEVNELINQSVSGKQDTLSAGTNITIVDNVISATGGGGGKAIEAGRGISVTTGATADTVSLNLSISAGTGTDSIQEGSNTIASGNYSHSEGSGTTASGNYSHSEGARTSATTNYSHAEGYRTLASGTYSHAEGQNTTASGDYSHTEGLYTSAQTLVSHAEGYKTITKNAYEHAACRFNKSVSAVTQEFGDSGNTLFSIGNGNGNSDSVRHNAFEARQNGDIYISNTNDTSTSNFYEKPMVKLQDYLASPTERSTWNSKVDSSTLNNYLLKSKIWCGTESEYNSIVNKDSETLYLIHE